MNEQEIFVIPLRPAEEKEVRAHYGKGLVEGATFASCRGDGFVLSIYRKVHGDGTKKMVIQGPSAAREARKWGAKPEEKHRFLSPNLYPQIGSDEVGTGDFFGPVVVVASYVEERDLPRLKELGIGDSKEYDDADILEVAPKLIAFLPYALVSLKPAVLNAHPEINLNAYKAMMHDKAYQLLLAKLAIKPAAIYQDQFAPKELYYHYLEGRSNVVKGVRFDVKGENKHPSVAAASMIARYAFLKKMEAMGQEYGVTFPLGASKEVERFAASFYKKKGLAALKETSKERFSTFGRIVGK